MLLEQPRIVVCGVFELPETLPGAENAITARTYPEKSQLGAFVGQNFIDTYQAPVVTDFSLNVNGKRPAFAALPCRHPDARPKIRLLLPCTDVEPNHKRAPS